MASKPIKIAVAGGGYGAKVRLPAYSELDEFEPVAVWSRRVQVLIDAMREADEERRWGEVEAPASADKP